MLVSEWLKQSLENRAGYEVPFFVSPNMYRRMMKEGFDMRPFACPGKIPVKSNRMTFVNIDTNSKEQGQIDAK